jgi:hypothetical protein
MHESDVERVRQLSGLLEASFATAARLALDQAEAGANIQRHVREAIREELAAGGSA